jgi:hypothetical protein
MLVRFYAIEWADEDAEMDNLPTSVTLEVEDGTDANELEMTGGDILQEEFGVDVDSFEWEFVDDDTEDPFSFVPDAE